MVVEGLGQTREQPRPDLVIHNLTQDDKETAISLTTAEEDEGTPVGMEVHDGGRVGARQTTEEEFHEITASMTHLGPHSA